MAMNRSVVELKKRLRAKISAIESFLKLATQEDLEPDQREEIISQIAVELRVLYCYSSGDPLIITAQMDKQLHFPLCSRNAPLNELNDFLLVGFHVQNEECTFSSIAELDCNRLYSDWLSYRSWINEVVVDIKTEGYPPLSRAEVIKIIANKEGAHVDIEIPRFVELINTTNVMQVRFVVGDKEYEADCRNLLYETILSIAQEAIFSYHYTANVVMLQQKTSEFSLAVYDYSDAKRKRYKYMFFKPGGINLYNTSRVNPCKITAHPTCLYSMLKGGRFYPVEIIKVEECDLNKTEWMAN